MHNEFLHFSVDDVIDCFEDIFVNDYESIFENEFLADWKVLHNETGLKLSLFCYYHNNTFSLDMFPDKYAHQFYNNSDWLRLGVHAFDYNVAKSDDWRTYYISYIRVMEELMRICGKNTLAIDFFPRLDCYKLPYMTWSKLRNYRWGPVGLLGNDKKGGNSYFLNSEQNRVLRDQGNVIVDDRFPICATTVRLDEISYISELDIKSPCICFTHEWLWKKQEKIKLMELVRSLCACNKSIGNYSLFSEDVLKI